MKQRQTISLAVATALLLAPLFAHAQPSPASAKESNGDGVRLWLSAPAPEIGVLKPRPRPSLTAYAIDANGKRDERVPAIRASGMNGGTFYLLTGTRVEIVSSLPVKAWTGPCAKSNPSPEPATKCIVTLNRSSGDQIRVSVVMPQ